MTFTLTLDANLTFFPLLPEFSEPTHKRHKVTERIIKSLQNISEQTLPDFYFEKK